jgi:hypothetical protein
MKAASTCFGLQRNHHQGATTSTWLKLQAWFNVDTDVWTLSVLWRHKYDLRGVCVVRCIRLHSAQHTRHTDHIMPP